MSRCRVTSTPLAAPLEALRPTYLLLLPQVDGGFFDAVGSTSIIAYDKDGNVLFRVLNTAEGIEFLALATDDGSQLIKGVLFSLVADEPGIAMDNLIFTYGCCESAV